MAQQQQTPSTNNVRAVDYNSLPEVVPNDFPESTHLVQNAPVLLHSYTGEYLPGTSYNQGGYNNAQYPMRIPAMGFQTVTPLYLLGEQPEVVDCPFCRQASQTKVKKHPSVMTHVIAAILFFGTLCGVIAPYVFRYYCGNCGRKVAYRTYGSSNRQVLGTPDHLVQASRYTSAPV
ncbi:hypothetical protein BGZ61DRAFT_466687 [Ilyonectria robusta]|uniref:uncharacterized protein n=1 Tax=Ilyonectria robusta TaxID=1079257 RepID=UPI001E8DCD66|nr:uncharacterized protein BGZ61DRAFT_466687 [Ilyonectria robusta]KAH8656368.1 hypothetical protein BGZ61DRAFT_466687 [Ilyonectria robusta]